MEQQNTGKTTAFIEQSAHPPPHPMLLGESYGFWCQTLVLLGATIFAGIAIRNSRAIEKKKAASAALFASRRDKELQEAISLIVKLHNGDTNIKLFARKENHNTAESKSIKYALNHYEYISVGIAEDIFDENVFKSGVFTTLTSLYDRTKPFIDEAREVTGKPTTFQEFECLACRWKADPLKRKPIKSVQA